MSMKKQPFVRGLLKFSLVCLAVPIVLWIVAWVSIAILGRTRSVSLMAPDKKLTALFWVDHGFMGLSSVGTTQFEIVNNVTGEKRHIQDWSYDIFDGYRPITVVWRPDSRKVVCIGSEDLGSLSFYPFKVTSQPFSVEEEEHSKINSNNDGWVKEELRKQSTSGDAQQQEDAKDILRRRKDEKNFLGQY